MNMEFNKIKIDSWLERNKSHIKNQSFEVKFDENKSKLKEYLEKIKRRSLNNYKTNTSKNNVTDKRKILLNKVFWDSEELICQVKENDNLNINFFQNNKQKYKETFSRSVRVTTSGSIVNGFNSIKKNSFSIDITNTNKLDNLNCVKQFNTHKNHKKINSESKLKNIKRSLSLRNYKDFTSASSAGYFNGINSTNNSIKKVNNKKRIFKSNNSQSISNSNNLNLFKTSMKIITDKDKKKYINIFRNGISKKNNFYQNTLKGFSIAKLFKPLTNLFSLKKKLPLPDKVLMDEYKPISFLNKNMKNKNIEAMNKEVQIAYNSNFKLSESENFSKKYQICSEVVNMQTNNNKSSIYIKKVNNNRFSIENQVNAQIEKYYKEEIKTLKKENLEKWKRAIITAAIHFKYLKISLKEFYKLKNSKILVPYENEGSYGLIQAVKDDDIKTVRTLINSDKLLAHDFDHFKQTALHWASKRNKFKIIKFLIQNGANIHAQDISGRTALHCASEKNFLESVKILLYNLADPFKRNNLGKLPIDLTHNNEIKYLLDRARIVKLLIIYGSCMFLVNLGVPRVSIKK